MLPEELVYLVILLIIISIFTRSPFYHEVSGTVWSETGVDCRLHFRFDNTNTKGFPLQEVSVRVMCRWKHTTIHQNYISILSSKLCFM